MGFYEKIKEFVKEDEINYLIWYMAVATIGYYLVGLIMITPFLIDGRDINYAIAGCIMMNLGTLLYILSAYALFKKERLSIEKRIEKLEERI